MEAADNRELLMTYTVFHIGTYITLAAAILAAQSFGKALSHPVLRVSLVLFVAAGICGAVVASNLPEFDSWPAYEAAVIGPWGWKLANYKRWAFWEHIFFWAGVIVPVTIAVISPKTLRIE